MCENCDWQEWLARIREIQELLPDLPEKAFDFASGVHDTLEGIGSWVEENEHITDAQKTAVENLDAGVQGWL